MKTKLNLLLFFVITLGFAGFTQTNTTIDVTPETVVIKILESNSFGIIKNIESKMIIIDNENHTEIKPLMRVNFNSDLNEGMEANTQKLRLELQIWHNKGFIVKSMSSVAPRDFIIITTIILQKN